MVLESQHPFNGKSTLEEVTIEGAVALELRFDWNSSLGKKDRIHITGDNEQEFTFEGLEHGTDASTIGASICVGDLVVRGPSWLWGEQDGGVGSIGEVLDVRSWKGKSNAGILVQWRNPQFIGLYRWNYEGHYDLVYFGPGPSSSRPLIVKGDTLRVAVDADVESANMPAELEGSIIHWPGAMRFEESTSAIRLDYVDELELKRDFTVDVWIRPASSGNKQVILARACDIEDITIEEFPLHQLVIRTGGDGQLICTMCNSAMTLGLKLQGGRLQVNKWSHIALTACDRTFTLFLDGVEVALGAFSGDRLDPMSAPLVIGNSAARVTGLQGHMSVFRIWRRALPLKVIQEIQSSMTLSTTEGLVTQLLSSVPIGDLAANIVLAHAPGDVEGARWDEAVEPVLKSESKQAWGYKITILPVYPVSSLSKIPSIAADYAFHAEPYGNGSLRHDFAIVRYINDVAAKKSFGIDQLLQVKWDDIAPGDTDLNRLPLIRELMSMTSSAPPNADGQPGKKRSVIASRYTMIQLLNTFLKDVLPLIDLGTLEKDWSTAALIAKCRGLIYTMLKEPTWNNALTATTCSGSTFELQLSRSRALKFASSGQVDNDGRLMVFSQAFRQIHQLPPKSLRRSDKLYTVLWMGERAHDAGGPYRESWSVYCTELQSKALPLLRQTQNGIHSIGQNREDWVVNPGATAATQLDMFSFLGKLMGVVIRNKEYLNLDLSLVVWKLLAEEPLSIEDLEAIDIETVRTLKLIRDSPAEGFEEVFDGVVFTTFSADDREVELIPGGTSRQLTYGNRLEYVHSVEQYRLREFDRQAEAIRGGLATTVPVKLLALFTWDEVEMMVCGKKQVDITLLKSVTEYSSCRSEDPHVHNFWEVLEGFSDEERSMFLRFCWGRSRLPLRADAFPQRFKINGFNRTPADNYLPVSHTCFFSLELPPYSSVEVMRAKLTYAIYNCQAIDGDDTTVGMQAASLGWED